MYVAIPMRFPSAKPPKTMPGGSGTARAAISPSLKSASSSGLALNDVGLSSSAASRSAR
jgi:hypothetical protein